MRAFLLCIVYLVIVVIIELHMARDKSHKLT